MKYISKGLTIAATLLAGGIFTACQQEVEVGRFDSDGYDKVDGIYCMLRNQQGSMARALELRTEPLCAQYYIELTQPAAKGVDLMLKIDPAVLDAYNTANKSAWEIFPAELVQIEELGAILIAPGDRKSDPVVITLTPSESLVEGKTYALPLATEVATEGIELASGVGTAVLFVKVLGQTPSTDKGTGIVTVCYIECNENNPLNAGEWFCTKSGKPLIDIVHLMSANIRYLEDEGRIGVKLNPNVQYILDNRDKYIKPLQDMGIKVCLSVLNDHDGVGVANLSDETARRFAAELKTIVDVYGLDGVDFDDEYAEYDKYPTRPGCVESGPKPYARLCFETKRAMPDKLCTVYYIGRVVPWAELGHHGFNAPIDGMMPADFVDYAYEAMYGRLNVTGWKSIMEMEKRQWGPCSIEITSANLYNLGIVRNDGYGVQVVYNLRSASHSGGHMQTIITPVFNEIAKKLYDDTIRFTGKSHEVDWI